MKPPILVALTASGAALGRRLQKSFPDAVLHGLATRIADADTPFTDTMAHLRALFASGQPIIGICAAGILIRALAPLLADKTAEPPVLALAEDGSTVVPLLGGHRGANALARRIAAALGIQAAVTTASDLFHGIALDAPPPGWRIADEAALKPVAAALIAGERVALRVEAGDAAWLTQGDTTFAEGGNHAIVVTHRAVPSDGTTLVYHPPVLALGVGGERGVDAAEVSDLVRDTLAVHGVSPRAIACVASIDVKADEAAFHALADSLSVPARFFDAATLSREENRLTQPSEIVRRAVGVAGVAEAAALAAAGPAARLIVTKTKSARATCAVALAPGDIDPARIGRARGTLFVVGMGPGAADWRTPEATQALAAANDIVGYGLYLDLLGAAAAGKRRHESGLGDEEARARHALDLAAQGRSVALVSSGDAGIYGLATLVFELVERGDDPAWARVDIRVCPGMSALQAAASRAGAPLGHDFCTISLSDLLTPWPAIEQRLLAAASGDFVVALYNPASLRRRDQLERAKQILLDARAPDTPVVLARNLGREGERVAFVRLGELDCARVDMLTILLIGNRQTRLVESPSRRWVYTPRGYAAKALLRAEAT